MAPDWDEDSPRLRKNLAHVIGILRRSAKERTPPSIEQAREWQRRFMEGLEPDDEKYVGAFRGERGLEDIQVTIGAHYSISPNSVAEELRNFEAKLQETVARLDKVIRLVAGHRRLIS